MFLFIFLWNISPRYLCIRPLLIQNGLSLLFLQLSLFAESFYEMLQFQMGSRILTFLQVGQGCFLSG